MKAEPAPTVKLFGEQFSADAFQIRDFLTRSVVHFDWIPIASDRECEARLGAPIGDAALPVVEFPNGERLRNPTLRDIAIRLGWVASPRYGEYDLSIYGAGPAGLSAAVYAASEGLRVVLLEREAVGGQAGSSSLIENYLGFPSGIRGADLAERARQQAVSFGAEVLLMREGIRGTFYDDRIHADLADGGHIVARANICATGVEWRRLGLACEDSLIGRGVYYGAGTSEASQCAGEHVYVVGGANSAGQAVMNLAAHATKVTMLVRGQRLSDTLSEYLESRIRQAPNVEVLTDTQITALHGFQRLRGLELTNSRTGDVWDVETSRVFICIGGEPDTAWTQGTGTIRDRLGYLVTGPDLVDYPDLRGHWPLTRDPFFLETNVPGSFAAGDVRHNSIKRVASAVGEGAMAVTFVHRYLAEGDLAAAGTKGR
ncbi:NAD(P)/FAD-dependent oxidoreductase [Frondihabitans australicus]|uniref:Thioredoxin reductase (NADPH) n=1 Tax=Frondihabitans australicus TaxID=386892 RepID=A0A495IKK8_9MICO|nr:FAD-dependent oxidoreductase [Frondihabitans australicus]RKR76319.1 thioredoxin reductase (NADPH) [Frondihabitans australicus]